ncbi:hypothetical protein ACFVZZ_18875 [Streptomyces chartreusis]|uniref:hypothetical protein n=1 Tax=Streptomyces chartreusis TaxID=1969 RepID=UPI0036DC52FE
MTEDFTDADAKAICAAAGVDTKTVTDTFGRTHVVIDEAGMRKLAALAPDPVRSNALVDQIVAGARKAPGGDQ